MYKQVGGNLWLLPAKSENKHVRSAATLHLDAWQACLQYGRVAARRIQSWISSEEVFEARAFLQAVACYHYGIDFINQYIVATMCGLHVALHPCTKVCHYLTQVAPS
jgi:hypothetical protein